MKVTNQFSLDKIRYNEKVGVLDIKAKIDDKDIVNIEMQRDEQKYYMQRILIYTGKLEASQLKVAEEYSQVENVISINILDHIMFEDIDKVHTVWKLSEEDNKNDVLDGIEFHFLELPKFRESNPDLKEKLNQWLALIDTENIEWMGEAMENNENVKKAKEKVDEFMADDEARILIELREKWEMDYKSSMSSAKELGMEQGLKQGLREGKEKGLREGKEKGLREGMEKGLSIGREEGIKQGRDLALKEAYDKKIEIAQKLLSKGMSMREVEEITGIIKDELEK